MEPIMITITLALGAVGLFYWFLIWNYGQWKKRGITEAKTHLLSGSFPSLFNQKQHLIYDIDEVYRKYKKSDKFVGVYLSRAPEVLILDAEYVHKIYVNDFKNFHDNEFANFVDEKTDFILGNNPFALKGEAWKERRLEIVPGMTPNRIKNAHPVTQDVCRRLCDYIKTQTKLGAKDGLDTNEMCLRYTSEVVADCVLGITSNSLTEKPAPLFEMTKELFANSVWFLIYQVLVGIFPSLVHFRKARVFSKKSEKYFFKLMTDSLDMRRQQNDSNRVDFLNYLLELQNKTNLPTNILGSHIMTFLTDGFITTASALSHCLLGLARNPEAQQKLRDEIISNSDSDGKLSFEMISTLPYLDACFHESLRLFPPLLFVTKLCTEPFEFVNKNGKSLKLKKDEVALVSHYSLHHDENYYSEPEVFKPERFLPQYGGISVKEYQSQGKFLGFGNGPRICLGMRFALTQVKTAVTEIVRNFNLKVNPKTRSDNLLDKNEFIGKLDGGVWLDFEAIN